MHRHLRVQFLFLALSPMGLSVATAAQFPQATAFSKAADSVIAAMGTPGQTAPPPVSDQRVQALLHEADVDAVFRGSSLTPSDLGAVSDLCGKANHVQTGYLLANFTSIKSSGVPLAELQTHTRDLAVRNSVTYQDVIAPMFAFGIRCNALVMPLLTEFFVKLPADQRTPVRLSGLAQMRNGAIAEMTGAIASTHQQGLSPRNHRVVISAAAATAPAYVYALPVVERKKILQAAVMAKAGASADDQASLDILIRALADERCEGLCAFSANESN